MGLAERIAPKRNKLPPDIHRRHWSYIYFIQAESDPPRIKIGKTKRLAKRLSSLRGSSPVPLRLVGLFCGYHRLELMFHRLFANSRLHGEWFSCTPDLLNMLERSRPGLDRRLTGEWAKEIFVDCGADEPLLDELNQCYEEIAVLEQVSDVFRTSCNNLDAYKRTLDILEGLTNT